jgi:hypothetical protein
MGSSGVLFRALGATAVRVSCCLQGTICERRATGYARALEADPIEPLSDRLTQHFIASGDVEDPETHSGNL